MLTLGELCDGKPQYGLNAPAIAYRAGYPRYVRITDIDDDGRLKNDDLATAEIPSGDYELGEGDMLFARTGSIGRTFLYTKKYGNCVFAGYLIRFRSKTDRLLPSFLLHYTHGHEYMRWLNSESTQGVLPNINAQQYSRLLIPIPSLAEQQKIASILSTADNLIQKTDEIIKQIQKLKKNMMLKLFTKGIDNKEFKQIKWRFGRDIEIPATWQVPLLDDISKRGTGHTPDTKIDRYYGGSIKWVSLSDLGKLDDVNIYDTEWTITEEGLENSPAVKHPAGTVIMCRGAGVGKCAILSSEMAVSQDYVTWRCGERLDNLFLYYMLQYWKPYFQSIAGGTTIARIELQFFKKFRIFLPPIEEQRQISNVLTRLDSIIRLERKINLAMSDLKRGLMQKLLTGQIRVKV